MKNILMTIVTLFFTSSIWSATITRSIVSDNYKEAQKKDEYLKFIGSSTKFGFITTSFEGYAKSIEISYELNEQKTAIKSFVITIPNHSFDTDNSARDAKLHETCLEENKFKKLRAELKDSTPLTEAIEAKALVLLTPKDVTVEIPLTYSLTKVGEAYLLKFKSSFSFKSVNIIDPSIAIAKVAEEFKLEGSLIIPK